MEPKVKRILFKYFVVMNEQRIKFLRQVLKKALKEENYEFAKEVDTLMLKFINLNNIKTPGKAKIEKYIEEYNQIIITALQHEYLS